jgi:dTDP-4-amino-4,6-dideoxygalactose transaminase
VTIPFINLSKQDGLIREEINSAVQEAISSYTFARGPQVAEFETAFRKQLSSAHCVACGNGTDALFSILKSLGVKRGDEVITPAFSWISSAEVISLCGATPVFADIEDQFFTIDPVHAEQKINARTKAIVVVHLYGQAANVGAIQELCKKYNLFLVEDCAQAHLTEYNGNYAGTFGNAGGFSFYPTKNLGAYGEAGCVIANDEVLAEKTRRFCNHGALSKEDHAFEGMNSRMDTIQAAVLLAKLPYLPKWNDARISHAALYSELLADIDEVVTPLTRPHSKHTFHIYGIRAERRDELQAFLLKHGIQTIIHYPHALPNLKAYRYLEHVPEDFPIASALETDVLSLPIYPELQINEIDFIAQKIKAFYSK